MHFDNNNKKNVSPSNTCNGFGKISCSKINVNEMSMKCLFTHAQYRQRGLYCTVVKYSQWRRPMFVEVSVNPTEAWFKREKHCREFNVFLHIDLLREYASFKEKILCSKYRRYTPLTCNSINTLHISDT